MKKSLRRRIGSKPYHCPYKASQRKVMREILEEEDKLWLELVRKEFNRER